MSKAIVVSMKNHLKPHNGKSHHPHHRPSADKPRRRRRAAASTATAPPKPRTGMSKKKLIEESRRWLSIINSHKLNDYKRRKVVTDTLDNFRLYYNKGYLEYRKSVTEGGEFAAIEWSGKGSYFEDITGRKFIDCLGGYGIYSAGINHPKVVRAVKSQLERMPLSSQASSTRCAEHSPSFWASWPPATSSAASSSTTGPTQSKGP